MLSECTYSSPLKSDGLINNRKRIKTSKCSLNNRLPLNAKNIYEKFSNVKSIDITSRLEQFAWRQIIPSTIFLPVIFRHKHREEYLCVQMIKIHLLSNIPSETIAFWLNKYPIVQYTLTIYEAELLHNINIFHSNGSLSKNKQLNYSKLDSVYLTPLNPFLKVYQLICSTPQLINSSQFWISSHSSSFNKSIPDKEKAVINNMYDPSKNILTKKSETNNSFCREIIFHGKEILSYCTTSSVHLNEKDNQTISCLSIQDIVSIYFPWSTIEQFIQICRRKQITRFKPDKSTDYDASLRLVNLQELEHHWNFILKELLPTTQTANNNQTKDSNYEITLTQKKSEFYGEQLEKDKAQTTILSADVPITNNSEEKLISDVNIKESTKTVECPLSEVPFIDNCMPEENKTLYLLNNSHNVINNSAEPIEQEDQSETVEQENQPEIIQQENQSETDTSQTKEENEELLTITEEHISLHKKSLKRNHRRRHRIGPYSSKQKRKQQLKVIHSEEFWMKKYSIEPFSILINRYQLPLH